MFRKSNSVSAFLFLPQFHLSFEGFGHIIPVFMRTLAIMLAQAELLPEHHPAIRYGASDVGRYSLFRLLGEAWFTLRTTRASPYQWGVFTSIMLMMATIVSAVVMAFMTIGFGFGQNAKAQLFSLTDAGGNVVDTSAPTIPAVPGPFLTGMFDTSVPPAGTPHGDYGIMLLDKALRQGMYGTGLPLQNAMRNAFSVYNTAAMVVAGIMLAWIIISVILDTARTGQIGGGRHNMVWAPIRILFALGLMIPLGTTGNSLPGFWGFSSGQLIVTKLAEWGSNLGTNTWKNYMDGVVSGTIARRVAIQNPTGLIKAYFNMWLCRVTYNGWTHATVVGAGVGASGYLPFEQAVAENVHPINFMRTLPTKGAYTIAFTNMTTGNLCGTLNLPFYDRTYGAAAAPDPFSTAPPEDLVVSTDYLHAIADTNNQPLGGNPTYAACNGAKNVINCLAAVFQRNVARAQVDVFVTRTNNGAIPFTTNGAAITEEARTWACDFAAQHIYNTADPALNPLLHAIYPGPGAPPPFFPGAPGPGNSIDCMYGNTPTPGDLGTSRIGDCGGSNVGFTGEFEYPTSQCLRAALQIFFDDVQDALNDEITDLEDAVRATWTSEKLSRGWPDMGRFYMDLGKINERIEMSSQVGVTVLPGDLVKTSLKDRGAAPGLGPMSGGSMEEMMFTVFNQAKEWWKDLSTETNTNLPGQRVELLAGFDAVTGQAVNTVVTRKDRPDESLLGSSNAALAALREETTAEGMMKSLWRLITKKQSTWLLKMFILDQPDVYPFVQLLGIGGDMFAAGWVMMGVVAILSFAGGAVEAGSDSLLMLLVSPIGSLLTILSTTMLMAGGLIKFYLPLLPFIRVAFAALTWIISVFEAVVMVPIAALAHLTTEGEGLAGGAKQAWILWLNVLLRPVLVVLGFIGGIMVFNAFFAYINASIVETYMSISSENGTIVNWIQQVFVAVVYIGMIYVVLNSTFKMMEVIPNALMRWMGGTPDTSFDDQSLMGNLMHMTADRMSSFGRGVEGGFGRMGGAAWKRSQKPLGGMTAAGRDALAQGVQGFAGKLK